MPSLLASEGADQCIHFIGYFYAFRQLLYIANVTVHSESPITIKAATLRDYRMWRDITASYDDTHPVATPARHILTCHPKNTIWRMTRQMVYIASFPILSHCCLMPQP